MRRLTKFMAKMLFHYIYVVWLISSLDLIAQCQCSQSANTSTSVKSSDDLVESRKLLNAESITSYANVISEHVSDDGVTKEFHYFHEPTSTYEPTSYAPTSYSPTSYAPTSYAPTASFDIPSNHQPIHQMDLNPYYSDFEPAPYIPGDESISTHSIGPPGLPILPLQPVLPVPTHQSVPNHILKITREPFWAPEVYKLEDQYIATFRNIKSSVMSIYYKMQDFVNYVMGLFSFGES